MTDDEKTEYLVWVEHCFRVEAASPEEAEQIAKREMYLMFIKNEDAESFSVAVVEEA
jgi:hypothetical protein